MHGERIKIYNGVGIIKEMPGSVASGTLCINTTGMAHLKVICLFTELYKPYKYRG
jgi:hypothetical protein